MLRSERSPRRPLWPRRAGIAKTSTALLAIILAPAALAQDARWDDEWDDMLFYDWEEVQSHARQHDTKEIPFDEAVVLAELNDTDGDLGFHASIDGEAWRLLEIEDPRERVILKIRGRGQLRRQGLTQLFFESAEPTFDELTPEEFFARFPEGDYEVSAVGNEGGELESVAEFTHLLPAPAGGIRVSMVPVEPDEVDCDEGPVPVVSEPVVIGWEPITRSHPEIGRTDEPIDIVRYQLVVEREEPTLLIYSVDLPPDVTALEVPRGFTALGEQFKFEILAREASGNQTAVESCFVIWGPSPS